MSAEYNFRFRIDWNVPRFDLDLTAGYIGQVKVLGYPVVGSPTQAQIDAAVAAYIEAHPGSLSPLSPAVKAALLQIAEKVVYIDEHGQDYYDALEAALNATEVISISAVFTQGSAVIYTTDTLDSLKQYLVVTATYDNGTTADVTELCTLSGTLVDGTSTITATYEGQSATFNVTAVVNGWLYHFDGDLLSSGTKDFGFTGTANYSTGYDGTGESYWHELTEGTSSTDPGAIRATGLASADRFNPSGDFTISMWHKTVTNKQGSILAMYNWGSSTAGTSNTYGATSNVKSGWTATMDYSIQKQQQGLRFAWGSSTLKVRLMSADQNTSAQYTVTPPNSFDSTQWHHYAITRSGSTLRFFVDGEMIFSATVSGALYVSSQITVCGYWNSTSATPTASGYAGYADDLYIANTCKWTSDFDPMTITY